ncbi:hypothetical protein B0A50_02140 [Salinomyces thailandicus]|uniref:Extracellular mutant protein 11 C-terminal domain-containing protein n=1 Tax=Salinomyces thailandicus TaxID=706561 RepID=A0A4U0UAJ6_9PEZI|nr:hypothetical protein B0A50_02140 [Salinomyces thailandica]
MALPQPGTHGMEDFVNRKNAANDLAEFKGIVPNLSAARNKASARQSLPTQAQAHMSSRQGLPVSGEPSTLYDTDASEADRTSAAPSLNGSDVTDAQRPEYYDDGQHDAEQVGDNDDAEYTEVENSDGDVRLPDDPSKAKPDQNLAGLSRKQWHIRREMRLSRQTKLGGSGFPYIKGDSYPSTTDGQLSASDREEYHAALRVPHRQSWGPPSMAPIPKQTRQSDKKQSSGAPLRTHSSHHPDARVLAQSLGGQGVGMHFGPTQGGAGSVLQRPQAELSLSKAPPYSRQNLAGGRAPHVSDVLQPQKPDTDSRVILDTAQHTSCAPIPARTTENRKPALATRTKKPAQHQAIDSGRDSEFPPDHEALEEQSEVEDYQPPDLPQQQSTKLDYEPAQLYSLSYHEVKNAIFDFAPDAVQYTMPDNVPSDDLQAQLRSAYRLEAPDQARFLAILDIESWEQAGDWFLDQFSELVSTLKSARQEKRQAAKLFEAEVEKRHHAVSKKRKLTENALGEMKASGAMVLQGTPNKARKQK